MGFRAPSADDVYRYVLRLDDSTRTLTDRFGWSILLVGDYSGTCREFLDRYCLDLCARTADRIRFVFFSGLPEHEFRSAAMSSRRLSFGTLGAVLSRLRRRETRLDFRDERWSHLRPPALVPLPTERSILDSLDHDHLQLSAVPGARASLEFAQKLGIGRHVPCLVIFTDVGDLNVHVLPFAGQEPEDVYRRVRGWIDDYYDLNRDLLRHWSETEKEVERRARPLANALPALRRWSSSHRETWRQMRRLAELGQTPPKDVGEVLALSRDHTLPHRFREALRQHARLVKVIAARSAAWQELAAAADDLAAEQQAHEVLRTVMTLLRGRTRLQLMKTTTATLLLAQSALSGPTSSRHAFQRWQNRNVPLFSRRRFEEERQSWRSIAALARRDGETIGEQKRRDHATFRAALYAQPLLQDAEKTADLVLRALADHYSVLPSSTEWTAATVQFRGRIARAIHDLQEQAPWAGAGTRIADCLPGDEATPASVVAQRRLASTLHHRDRVLLALADEVHGRRNAEAAQAAAWAALPALVEGHRAELETRLLGSDSAPALPAASDADDLLALASALDEYENAVASVRYPHLADPAALPVPVLTSVSEATGLAVDQPRAVDRLRTLTEQAVTGLKTAISVQRYVERDVDRHTPSGMVAAALDVTLSPARLTEIGRIQPSTRVLGALTGAELAAAAAELGCDVEGLAPARARAALRLHLGLGPHDDPLGPASAALAEQLQTKIANDAFDVFMAHHSEDQPAVLEVCAVLRQHGIHPWIDVEQVQPGTWFQDALQHAIRTVKAAAVFLGPSGAGRWQMLEIRAFVERCVSEGVQVIPVLLPDTPGLPTELVFLQQLNVVRFDRSVLEAAPLRRLVWGITGEKPA
ncbi:hypothetical protein BBK82_34345 [Lentzea guizhouensis]|uniref:TIR domain-containing protein n=1 Tax=Lentzea guizhouensis TaxID=1586287 RepID=A0A1B2HRJ5_9PSEU|nr:toll/interleukin-1 receptor domain-containing protein [Lentzea guizhouensis]ANZ40354.1 hypothetical protein BBK82_34345 [Lentzea guizhouensis]